MHVQPPNFGSSPLPVLSFPDCTPASNQKYELSQVLRGCSDVSPKRKACRFRQLMNSLSLRLSRPTDAEQVDKRYVMY
jgi:hypothetical protein